MKKEKKQRKHKLQRSSEICRDAKFSVRDYPFTKQWHEEQNRERHAAMANFRLEHFKLLEKGHTIFSDMFQLWVHVKILRAGMDCVLRYGFCIDKGPKKIGVLLVAPNPAKMVQFHQDLASMWADTTEQAEQKKLNEGGKNAEEDAHPYAFVPLVPLSSSLTSPN